MPIVYRKYTYSEFVRLLYVYVPMSKKIKFKVSDKLVKQRDGASYSLSNYTEGVDYVMRGCFKGQKAVFREDILGNAASIAEHIGKPVTLEVTEQGVALWTSTREFLEAAGHVVRPATEFDPPQGDEPKCKEIEHTASQVSGISRDVTTFDGLIPEHCPIQECKIKKIYNNFKWVETDKGRVWVGLKGSTMRVGQVIRVKNGELFLGKTAPSSPLVRI